MKKLASTFVIFLYSLIIFGQGSIPEPMNPPCLVNDFAKLFTSSQQYELEQMLRAYNDTTSTQIYVVTVNSLEGYAVSDFATHMGQQWGIGQKDKDNGVLIIIKPRIDNERGEVFIATGYGVEHVLTDARCGRIIDEQMIPHLRNGDYYNASLDATKKIMQCLTGEFGVDDGKLSLFMVIIIIILMCVVTIIFFIIPLYLVIKVLIRLGAKNTLPMPPIMPPIHNTYYSPPMSTSSFGHKEEDEPIRIRQEKEKVSTSIKEERTFKGGGGGSFGGGGAGRSF